MTDENPIAKENPIAGKSPGEAFQVLYETAPPAVQEYLDGRALEIMMVDIPKLQILIELGPAVAVEDNESVADTYNKAMVHTKEAHPEVARTITATVEDCGRQIAELIDKSVKRVLLDDELANRHAAINLTACHAKLVKCLADIALTQEQLDQVEGWDSGA